MKQDHLRRNVAPMFNQSFILNHGIFLNPNWTRHPDILRVLQIFLLDVVRASFCRELDLQKYLFVFSALLLLIHFLLHCCASAVSNQPVHCPYKKKYGKNIVNIVIAITFYALPSASSVLCSALLYALPYTWLPGAWKLGCFSGKSVPQHWMQLKRVPLRN